MVGAVGDGEGKVATLERLDAVSTYLANAFNLTLTCCRLLVVAMEGLIREDNDITA